MCLGSYAPSGELLAWRDRNHKWLELMEVHTQETSRIRVTVMPFYMGRKELHSGSMGTILAMGTILYTCVNMCVRSCTTAVLSHTLEGLLITYLDLSAAVYWWRYNIRLENLGQEQVQLRERHWKIYSLTGRLETVKGKGVIGQEPILSLSQPAFQYSSHVSLRCPSGHMW